MNHSVTNVKQTQASSQGGGRWVRAHPQWFVPHPQTLGPSALLTTSPILIHYFGVFNIDICAIWHKIAEKFDQNC